MIKNQNFYQSILQNSTLVIKVSGKICDNQDNIDNVISDIKELLNSISKKKVRYFLMNKNNPLKIIKRNIIGVVDKNQIKK